MEQREKYFETEWKCNRTPNNQKSPSAGTECTVYCMITKEFEETLASKLDGGSALISNIIKSMDISIIGHVGRENNCVAVTFINDESVWSRTDDELIGLADEVFEVVIKYTTAWPKTISDNPDELVPLYASGAKYKPDVMFGMIDDVCINYNTASCIYSISFNQSVYDGLVKKHRKYFEYILKDVMMCNSIELYDEGTTLIAVDNNKGLGPTVDRADAIALAAMFAAMNIIQILDLRG